eukprot:4502489-Pyramimonas_sp.AAC.1
MVHRSTWRFASCMSCWLMSPPGFSLVLDCAAASEGSHVAVKGVKNTVPPCWTRRLSSRRCAKPSSPKTSCWRP